MDAQVFLPSVIPGEELSEGRQGIAFAVATIGGDFFEREHGRAMFDLHESIGMVHARRLIDALLRGDFEFVGELLVAVDEIVEGGIGNFGDAIAIQSFVVGDLGGEGFVFVEKELLRMAHGPRSVG
jgi:hypothetical protein